MSTFPVVYTISLPPVKAIPGVGYGRYLQYLPFQKTCKLTKHSALVKTYLVSSLPIRMLSRSLILWRHCFEMTSSTFDVKNKNPTPYSIRTQSDNIYHAANAPEIHMVKTGYNSNYSGPRVRMTLFKARLHTMPWVLELRQMIQSL